jgi:hypothetical protein
MADELFGAGELIDSSWLAQDNHRVVSLIKNCATADVIDNQDFAAFSRQFEFA